MQAVAALIVETGELFQVDVVDCAHAADVRILFPGGNEMTTARKACLRSNFTLARDRRASSPHSLTYMFQVFHGCT